MSRWSRRVAAALKNSKVRNGIAQLAVAWMDEHITDNRGQPRQGTLGATGAGPDGMKHRPLKPMFGRVWKKSKPKAGFKASRTVSYVDAKGKTRTRTEYLTETPGYRNGGQPLRDTGRLAGSLNARANLQAAGIRLVLRGLNYGLWQDKGFKTAGPNYIPLTRRGKRYDNTAKAKAAGLQAGRDFTGAKRGVTVPGRPFLLPTKVDRVEIGRSIKLGLESILKGF